MKLDILKKVNLLDVKCLAKNLAREYFPTIPVSRWALTTLEWEDGDFRVEYFHTLRASIRYVVSIKISEGGYKHIRVLKEFIAEQQYGLIIEDLYKTLDISNR